MYISFFFGVDFIYVGPVFQWNMDYTHRMDAHGETRKNDLPGNVTRVNSLLRTDKEGCSVIRAIPVLM